METENKLSADSMNFARGVFCVASFLYILALAVSALTVNANAQENYGGYQYIPSAEPTRSGMLDTLNNEIEHCEKVKSDAYKANPNLYAEDTMNSPAVLASLPDEFFCDAVFLRQYAMMVLTMTEEEYAEFYKNPTDF